MPVIDFFDKLIMKGECPTLKIKMCSLSVWGSLTTLCFVFFKSKAT